MTIKSLLTTKKFETTRWKDFLKMNILHTFRKRERGMIYDFQFTAAEKRTVRFCFSVLSLVATATVWQRPTSLPPSDMSRRGWLTECPPVLFSFRGMITLKRRDSVDLETTTYQVDRALRDRRKKLVKRNTIADFYKHDSNSDSGSSGGDTLCIWTLIQ